MSRHWTRGIFPWEPMNLVLMVKGGCFPENQQLSVSVTVLHSLAAWSVLTVNIGSIQWTEQPLRNYGKTEIRVNVKIHCHLTNTVKCVVLLLLLLLLLLCISGWVQNCQLCFIVDFVCVVIIIPTLAYHGNANTYFDALSAVFAVLVSTLFSPCWLLFHERVSENQMPD